MDFFKHFFIHILVAIAFIILAYYFPNSETEQEIISLEDFKKIESKYRKWDLFFIFLMVIIISTITYLLTEAFVSIYQKTEQKDGAIFNLLTSQLAWYFPFTLIAGAIYLRFYFQISKSFLGRDFKEYLSYSTRTTHGIDNQKLAKPLIIVCLGISFIGILWMDNYRAYIFNDHIEYNELSTIGFAKTYGFHDIEKIDYEYYYSEKKLIENHKIVFKDSNYWLIHGGMFFENQEAKIAQFLSNKSKIKVDTIRLNDM
jgi:hypothetical protein